MAIGATKPRELTLVVTGGPHGRWHCPVSVTLDTTDLESAGLVRAGRLKPWPCQVTSTRMGTEVTWLVGGMAPSSSATWHLRPGSRSSRARIHIEPSATGYLVNAGNQTIAEMFCPADAPPRVQVRTSQLQSTNISLNAAGRTALEGFATSVRLRRKRLTPPECIGGPVFGQIVVSYCYVTASDLPLLREYWISRWYAPAPFGHIADLTIVWEAAFGPVRLGEQSLLLRELLPILGIRLADGNAEAIHNSMGAIGRSEIDGRVASWLAAKMPAESGVGWVAIMAASNGFALPPRWDVFEDGAEARPNLLGRPAIWPLALGESVRLRYRLLVTQPDVPLRLVAARFLDFDCPPAVTIT